jgi:hypothetical protein
VKKKLVPFCQALRNLRKPRQSPLEFTSLDPEWGSTGRKKLSKSSTSTGASVLKYLSSWSLSTSAKSETPTTRDTMEPFIITTYTGEWMLRISSTITTVVACLLPTVAISVLAELHTMGQTLGAIAGFTALFALGLSWLTGGTSRVEIFTATAA